MAVRHACFFYVVLRMFKIAWSNVYAHELPPGHRFPMLKYELLPEQLVYEGTINEASFFAPEPLPEDLLLSTHDAGYWKRLSGLQLTRQEVRKTGFPHSEGLINRERIIMQGTVDAANFALHHGVAMNIAGGTHHAYPDRGEGFCLLNDNAIAANYLLAEGKATKILIVDLDVHQGNGTAAIFANEPRVFTFSMHGAKNYPLHKETSDLDVGLADGTDGPSYLRLLRETLLPLLDSVEPDFVFFQSGVDVLATDKLGRLGLSIGDCRERDRILLSLCHRNNIPLLASMGDGYSENIRDIVEAHANTYRIAAELRL